MQSNNIIHTVSCHAEGEVGDVITAGVPTPPRNTLWQQRAWVAADNSLRNFILNELRDGVFSHVNLLVPPTNPTADAVWIIMEPGDTPPISGSKLYLRYDLVTGNWHLTHAGASHLSNPAGPWWLDWD